MKIIEQYKGLFKSLGAYYSAYGGISTFAFSPLVHLAILITFFANLFELSDFWIIFTQSAFPTILGFSLAAYTIVYSMIGSFGAAYQAGSEDLNDKRMVFSRVNATFFHAIFWQIISLLYSLTFNFHTIQTILSHYFVIHIDGLIIFHYVFLVFGIIGNFLMFYSILLMFSLLLGVFRLANASIDRL